ncbi:MAG: hypothetical protein WA208_10460 [Thermoanaerobaculia bacterium]
MTRIIATICLLLAACSGRAPGPIATELTPPVSATNVKHTKIPGFERVTYTAEVQFPPKNLIQEFAARAAKQGWKPLAESVFNKGETAAYVEGWRKRVVAAGPDAPRRWAYIWWSQWVNDREEILDATFSYEYPRDGQPNLQELFGNVTVVSKERLRDIGGLEPAVPAPEGLPPVTDAVIEEPDLERSMRSEGGRGAV